MVNKQCSFRAIFSKDLINLLEYTQYLSDILETKELKKTLNAITIIQHHCTLPNLSRAIYLPLHLFCSQISSLDKCRNNVKIDSPPRKNNSWGSRLSFII